MSLYSGNQLIDVPATLYSQDDPGVIEGDVRAAAGAGLAGFIVRWAGSTSEAARLDEVLAASNRIGGFTNWLALGTSSLPTAQQLIDRTDTLLTEHGADPAWARLDGKPVLVFIGSRKFTDDYVAQVSAAVRNRVYLVGDESASSLTDVRLALFDGLTYYWSTQNPWTNPTSFNRIAEMGATVHAAGKRWFPPFTPGYDSILNGGSTCVPRRGGETMRTLFNGNAASNPDGWALISWNEIAENSHIQPLTKWGDTYLRIVDELARG